MFGFLFGWRKASKVKTVVKQLQCHLKQLEKRNYSISSHLRKDIAQLLRMGEHERALVKAQQLFLDENLMSVYQLLHHFSEIVLSQLSYIRKHKDLPDSIDEAISTLIFASRRFGELPELRILRLLFGDRYGKHFVDTALHLLPSNRVNPEIKHKVSVVTVSDEAKSKLLGEIAKENNLGIEVLALQYTREFHKEVFESEVEEEEEEVKGSSLSSSQESSLDEVEVCKFTLIDTDEENTTHNKVPRDQREVCDDEYDCKDEEEVSERDQSVLRFEERRKRKRRIRSSSSSSPSSAMENDTECWRYYYHKGNRRRRQKRECGPSYHIVYNVFTTCSDEKENEEGERVLKEAMHHHVHPKLPDYDEIIAHFTALRKQEQRTH